MPLVPAIPLLNDAGPRDLGTLWTLTEGWHTDHRPRRCASSAATSMVATGVITLP